MVERLCGEAYMNMTALFMHELLLAGERISDAPVSTTTGKISGYIWIYMLPACCQLPDCNSSHVVNSSSFTTDACTFQRMTPSHHTVFQCTQRRCIKKMVSGCSVIPVLWNLRLKQQSAFQLKRRSQVALRLCSLEERAEPEQATLTGETLTWYSTKHPISHQADRKQIETGRKSIVETNDRQACRVIWHCLIGLFCLLHALVPLDTTVPGLVLAQPSVVIWWCAHCLKLL